MEIEKYLEKLSEDDRNTFYYLLDEMGIKEVMVKELKEPSRQQEVFETAIKINEMEEKNNA